MRTAALKGARRGLYASAVLLSLPLALRFGFWIGAVCFGHDPTWFTTD